jgi:outer membrane protein assembly factor BamB
VRRAVFVLVVLAIAAAPARAATPSTVTLRGDATHDNRVIGAPEPPLGVHWAVDLGAAVSYPVIAEGMVFVTVRPPDGAAYGTTAVALDLATGGVRWTRPVSGAYYWSALAYDQGRLFLVNGDGRLSAIAPATGATLWTTQLSQYSFSSPPVAYDGYVYLTGAGSGMTAYAVRASDGAVVWERALPSGAGTPAVDAGSVYVSMVCRHAVALSRATGAVRWEYHGACAGGGESTPALHGGRMYPLGDNGAIYDAATGATVGEANFHGYVAFADGVAYVPWLGGILAVDAASWMLRWTVAGDGGDVGEAPLVAAGHLYVGSEDAYVAAVRRSDGVVSWCAATAGVPVLGATGNVDRPDAGLGAGGSYLVVPAGRFLVAYAAGGARPAPCTGTPASGGGGAPAALGPSLSLRPQRADVVAGRSVALRGVLAQPAAVAAVTVGVDADAWPFDGRWRRVGSATTAPDGRFSLRVRPRRNTRYRALAAGLTSADAVVYAQLSARFHRRDLGGRRFRETFVIGGPRGTRLAARRIHFYLIRAGRRVARHAASARIRRVRPGVYASAATLRYLTPRRSTVVLACYREPTPDPWGRAYPLDRRCGARRLTLPAPARRTAAITALQRPLARTATARFTAH